jgi:DNA replication protein DnaC
MSDTRTLRRILDDCTKRFAQGRPPAAGSPPLDDAPPERRHDQPEHATIPRAFRWATLDGPELRQRVARGQAIAEGEAALSSCAGLLLVGPSGSGKTSLACALLRAWEARHPRRRGVFVPAWRLGVARAQYGLGQGEAPEVERAMACALLVLDDLGSERPLSTNAVPDVICARADTALPTWVTTWMTPEAVAQRYGDGIARRLYEAGRVVVIGCGKDS